MANAFWEKEIAIEKIPVPETYYTSPLSRCLDTAKITFAGLEIPSEHPFIPVVKEVFCLHPARDRSSLIMMT